MFEAYLALIVFLFPLAYSPGPGNLFFAAAGARHGLVATLPASAGYHLATWCATLVLGYGYGALTGLLPAVAGGLRWAGSGYVLWLALGFLRKGHGAHAGSGRRAGFADGAILLLLNPKAYVIIALMFSQFPGAGQGGAAVLLIATVFTLNNLLAFTVWTIAGDRLGALFRGGRASDVLNLMFGAMLVVVAFWMAVAGTGV